MQEHAGLELATTIFNIKHNVGMRWQGHAFGMDRVWIWYGSGMDRATIPFGDSWGLLPGITEHILCIVESWIEHEYKKRPVEKQPVSKLSAVSKLF